MEVQPTEKAPCIFRIEQFVCNGMLLDERTVVEGEQPKDFIRFAGTLLGGQETPFGVIERRIQFPIDAQTKVEAFAKFKAAGRAHIEALRAAAQTQIAVPTAAPKGSIILP